MHTISKRFMFVLALILGAMSMSGCYWNQTVENTNRGIQMSDGVSINAIVQPGRYTDMAQYATMEEVDVTNKTSGWEDPSLVTKDKQPISMKLTLTYARKEDSTSITSLYMQYRAEAVNDDSLKALVMSRVPEVAKSISATYSLDQMLGISGDTTRDQVASEMARLLAEKLDSVFVRLVSVQLNDIGASQTYMDMLNQKAASQLEVELAKQKTLTLAETLKQVEAQNKINLSVAVNANEVAAESAKALRDDRLYQLKLIEAQAKAFGNNDKVFFIPADSNLNIITTNGGNVTPIK